MKAFKGIGVSPGFANGNVFVYETPLLGAVQCRDMEPASIDDEYKRFCDALKGAVDEVVLVRQQVACDVGENEAAIFDAHIAMLNDNALSNNIHGRLERERVVAERALADEIKAFEKRLTVSKNGFMRELALDVHDIGNRVLRHLLLSGRKNPLAELPEDSIVVAIKLMPSETVGMDRKNVSGIATVHGGPTSHAVILARSLGLPAVTGLEGLLEQVKTGDMALLDGVKGSLVVGPSPSQRKRFAMRRKSFEQSRSLMLQLESKVCRTRNGTRIKLMANINQACEVDLAKQHNMDGIGLFRTELLYMQACTSPSCAMQYRDYKQAAKASGDLPVTIRTFDFAVDKHPSFLSVDASSLELRGLRFALNQPRLFKSQLRAIIRGMRDHPNLRILLPMVTGWWEVKEALELVQAVSEEEKLERPVPVGAMIETPAAVFALPEILGCVDFISIGCNDLSQYMLACERTHYNHGIGETTLHPSLLRAVNQIVTAANQANRPVCVCGEAASDPVLAAVFTGLGVRELSVSPARAPIIRYALRHLSLAEAKRLADHALHAPPTVVFDELQAILPASFRSILNLELGA